MSVEDGSDELWVAVKCQSNSEIAGSPRNVFRYSLRRFVQEVEHWMGAGPNNGYQAQPNSECLYLEQGVRRRVLTSVVKRETTRTSS